ncbi:MAG: hypothetical protein JSS61_01915 [Verrucomicrobia bacterium]|nr:hypothetical protein [Verrucomicrobiota bacterium]
MFRRATLFSWLILALLTLVWGVGLGHFGAKEIAQMKEILDQQEHPTSDTLFSTTHQHRKGVVKEIWFTQEDNTRLEYRICSASSELTLVPLQNKFDLIEKLQHIQCWMQDKFYNAPAPMQQVRFLRAEEGIYRFTQQEFLAQSVALSLFRLGGQALPKEAGKATPFLKGIAEDVSFSVSGKTPQFHAQNFKAQLNTLEDK